VVRPLGELFQSKDYPALLVGLAQPDDAAVYRLNESQAIVSTVDYFPPVVDDPYQFGAIAAANALSDVYAMGGEPLFVLNLAGWPDGLDPQILGEILRGAAEKVREAGAVVAGGHTISDREPKYGLAVTGWVPPDRIWTKGGAQPGDILLLTKPLGTGAITTALKQGQASTDDVTACVASMGRLNRAAAHAAHQLGGAVHAVTDVTGFGLIGHAHEMAHLSGCGFQIEYIELPWLPGARKYASQWIFPGGSERNQQFYEPWVKVDCSLKDWENRLMYDPQTSGGLLLALEPGAAIQFMNTTPAWQIGAAETAPAGHIRIV
jgi:selenide,water dikinase